MRKSAMFVRSVAVLVLAGLALSAGAAHGDEPGPGSEAAAPDRPAPRDGPERAGPTAPTPAFSDRPSLRTPAGEVVLLPTARLQVDAAFFPRQTPKSGAFLRRARVGLAGWLGDLFYFDVSVDGTPAPPDGPDSVAPAALSPADDY